VARGGELRSARPGMAARARPASASTAMIAHPPLIADPLWFQKAVFYELSVRAFYDGNNDASATSPG